MARILAISSQVAHGTVGLSIVVPALHALGHGVIGLPTVVLSNHPGHAHVAGDQIAPKVLHAMLDALEDNGWLAGLDAVLTGYLPTGGHVAFAAEAVRRVRVINGAHRVTYLCDPVLGDDPKGLYINEEAARSIRSALVPVADLATPNRFEQSYLTGVDVRTPDDSRRAFLDCFGTFATSIPADGNDHLYNVMSGADDGAMTVVPRRAKAPHGTGDLFSALLLSAWLDNRVAWAAGRRPAAACALAFATAGVDAALATSTDPDAISVAALPRAGAVLDWAVVPLLPPTPSDGWSVTPIRRTDMTRGRP
jgi:pyridoxine kinase